MPAGDNAAIRDDAAHGDAAIHSDAASGAAVSEPVTTDAATAAPAVDPDLAAFEAAERDHPGTFSAPVERREPVYGAEATEVIAAPTAYVDETPTVADTAYSSRADAETTIVPSEPAFAAAAPSQPQPIFVQAPEPPRDRGNRGTAGAIGLLATLAFAVLYLGATLGLGALAGDVDGSNIGQAARTAADRGILGAGRGLLPRFLAARRDHQPRSLGPLGRLRHHRRRDRIRRSPSRTALPGAVLDAHRFRGRRPHRRSAPRPLAIVAFVFARELTIWFGAWVARSGARKTELNLEAQREYERTLEAGPTLSR